MKGFSICSLLTNFFSRPVLSMELFRNVCYLFYIVAIARVQASWSEAASNDPEFLTVDEFLAFEHPEASPTKIIANVEDLLTTFGITKCILR